LLRGRLGECRGRRKVVGGARLSHLRGQEPVRAASETRCQHERRAGRQTNAPAAPTDVDGAQRRGSRCCDVIAAVEGDAIWQRLEGVAHTVTVRPPESSVGTSDRWGTTDVDLTTVGAIFPHLPSRDLWRWHRCRRLSCSRGTPLETSHSCSMEHDMTNATRCRQVRSYHSVHPVTFR
jgi:hypothetical protein